MPDGSTGERRRPTRQKTILLVQTQTDVGYDVGYEVVYDEVGGGEEYESQRARSR
jgi:hypothetical protein